MKRFALLALLLSVMQTTAIQVEAKKLKHAKTPRKICQSDKQMDKITSFTYQQSGGFAGINRSYSVKLADLSNEERDKLAKLIESSGLLSMNNERKTTPGAADMFFYEFTAVNGAEHKAAYDDGQLPQAFRPLVEYARDKATNVPRR
ncbi:MAG: hypothetical protein IT342_18585 [Candidatus Melainabacteria bacterium]|nr:hypothetical protein [Candidatus Melainabacteria bacterium]